MLASILSASLALLTPSALHGNHVFRPPGEARALVSFLGGAFVGAAPQATYAQLLRQLSEAGCVVLATPYVMQFDYLRLCEEILCTAEPAVAELRREYGDLPLVGVGHSGGALLHVLLSSVFQGTGGFADAPRAANVLISYNNRRAADSIPLFKEVVTPAASSLLSLEGDPAIEQLRALTSTSRKWLESLAAGGEPIGGAGGAAADLLSCSASYAASLLPVVDQIEPLFRQIDSGTTEFTPNPDEVRRAAAALYAARRTLLLRFDDDPVDQTPELESVLQSVGGVQLSSLTGSHLTPLTPSLLDAPPLPPPFGGPAFDAALLNPDTPAGRSAAEYAAARDAIVGFIDAALEAGERAAGGGGASAAAAAAG